MSALARWCYQHRFVVMTAWIGLLIGLAALSQAVKTSYDNSLLLPGTGSGSAQELLARSAPAQAGDADQIVWRVSRGSVHDPAVERRMSAMLAGVSRLPEVASVASPYLPDGAYLSGGSQLPGGSHPSGGTVQVSADGRTAYAAVNFTKPADILDKADIKRVISVAAAAREPGLAVELGGKAISGAEEAPLSAASAIGIGAAAVILLVAFGSLFAMTLPIVTAVAGVGSGLMLMAPLSHLMSVNGIAPILGALIGLGVGVDYALFVVTRYRRGLQSGLDPRESTFRALNTAGRAVLFAGGTVCISLLGLLIVGLGFIDGLAVPAAITVVCTVIAAVTLLPALFGVLGTRVLSRRERRGLRSFGSQSFGSRSFGSQSFGSQSFGSRSFGSRSFGSRAAASGRGGLWARLAGVVPRFPAVLAAVSVAVMIVISAPVAHLRLGFADSSNDPASSTTYKAYKMLAAGFGPGFNGPLFLVAQTQSAADRAALDRLDRALAAVPGVAAVQSGPAAAPSRSSGGSFRSPGGSSGSSSGPEVAVTQVLPATAPDAPATASLIDRLRGTVIPRYTRGTTLRVYVGGVTATFTDLAAVTSAKLPWLLAIIVGFSFLLLMLAFRSLLIPATTAALNLLSAAASFGVLTAFFQWGWGTRAFGLGAPSPVEGYLPELVLAILFGLSMDYQVFLVSAMAEEWSRTRDNARSVLAGQTRTARVITAAALIMIAVFTGFVFLGQRDVAEFGVGLAIAVALDAFVLRTVLVPAVMHLAGRANWWLPRWLDRRLPHLAIEPPADERSGGARPSALVLRRLRLAPLTSSPAYS